MKLRLIAVCPLLAAIATCLAVAASAQTSVILISIDTLRADHLSAYGYTRVHTPNIDSFADHGTIFTEADCQIPFTMPSHASMLTSTYPFENQVEENAVPIAPGAATLATVLHSRGYKTAAFVSTAFLEKQMGLDAGFDFYDSPFNYDAFSPMSGTMFLGATPGNPNAGRDRRDGALVVRAARQWITENAGANHTQPVFAFVHLFDMHKPYDDGYDGRLAYVDRLIGTLKQTLVQAGLWDKALVILSADHGESLGDHGESSHGYFIYESTLHVPLMIHWPAGRDNEPARVTDPAGLIDVAPTVIDFLHLPMPPSFKGSSLLAAQSARAVYGESIHAHDAFGWAPLRSLRVGQYKYIEAPRPELYNLRTDPHELTNVYVKSSPEAIDLRNQLVKLLTRYAPKKPVNPTTISPATRALLDSLGYLSGGPRTSATGPGADPKDRLPEFRMYEDAQLELYHRKITDAIATLRQLLMRDPQNFLARRDLGSSYVDIGEYASARTAFQQVLRSAPDDYMANYEIGLAEDRLGLLNEAKEHLETACRIAPESLQSRKELAVVQEKIVTRKTKPVP